MKKNSQLLDEFHIDNNNSAFSTVIGSPITSRKRSITPNFNRNSNFLEETTFVPSKQIKSRRIKRSHKSASIEKASISSLRETSPKYSFSKDMRFKQSKGSHLDIQYLTISTNQNKTCTFGKGNRTPISSRTYKNSIFTPSPDRYNLSMYTDLSKGIFGKSFGIPWNRYQKTYIKHRKDAYAQHFTKDNVAAIYDVRQKSGKDKLKFSIHGRLKMFNEYEADLQKMIPGPQYDIKEDLVRNKRGLNQRSFGFGQRIDLAKPANNYPSPASYNIQGFCSKFKVK